MIHQHALAGLLKNMCTACVRSSQRALRAAGERAAEYEITRRAKPVSARNIQSVARRESE